MSTKHLMKKLPSCLLGAILAAGIASTTVNAVDGDPLGQFELDGNTQDDIVDTNLGLFPGAGTDWDVLDAGTQPDNLIAFTTVLPDPAPQTIFWKGGAKDVNNVSEWWYKEGGVSDKSNITNAYAAAFSNPINVCVTDGVAVEGCADDHPDLVHAAGDLIVYFGMDRFANSGDTFGGFWFFQDPDVGIDLNSASGQFTGTHVKKEGDQPGDVLVLVEYPQASGAKPEIKVYEWDPDDLNHDNVAPNLELRFSSAEAECDGSGAKLACAIVNLVSLPNPAWDYTPKGGNSNSDMPTQTFFEGGINLTGILGTTPCISSFLAETRSARSETASLEDFAFGEFDACGAKVSKSCESVISPNGDAVTVTFFGEVNNTGGLPLEIELEDLVFETGGAEDEGTPGLSTFTKVCVDTNENLRCDVEADIAGFTPGGTIASFTLGGGQTVVYEGEYVLTSFDEETPFTDKVIMSFFDPGTGDLIDMDFAISAECSPQGNPHIDVFKACAAEIVGGGSQIERTITGFVKNDGNVQLIDVSLVDDTLDEAQFTFALDGGDGVPGGDDVGFAGELSPGDILWYEFTFTNTTMTHSNTVTASGTNVFDPTSDPVTDTSTVNNCAPVVVQGLAITKACNPEDAGVSLKQVGGVLVVEVSNVIEVKNVGNGVVGEGGVGETLAVTVSDDQVEQLIWVIAGGPAFDCSAGNSCTGELKFGESAKFQQSYRPDLGLSEGASLPLNNSSLAFSNTAKAEGTGVLSGQDVVPDPTATAECPLCPAPTSN